MKVEIKKYKIKKFHLIEKELFLYAELKPMDEIFHTQILNR